MDSPETYNRVSQIESTLTHNSLKWIKTLLLLTAVSIAWLSYSNVVSLSFGVILCSTALILAALLWRIIISRSRCCRFCGGPLDYINREMILNSNYLAMRGTKQGDYYYAPNDWAKKHSATGWAKISPRAQACHYCRISKESYNVHQQAATEQELSSLNITTGSR